MTLARADVLVHHAMAGDVAQGDVEALKVEACQQVQVRGADQLVHLGKSYILNNI